MNWFIENGDIILPAIALAVNYKNLGKHKIITTLLISHELLNLISFVLAEKGLYNIFCYQANIFLSTLLIVLFINAKYWYVSLLVVICFLLDDNTHFNSVSWCVGALIIIYFSVTYMIRSVKRFSNVDVTETSNFYFVGGLLFYYGITFIIFNAYYLLTPFNYNIYWLGNILFYLGLVIWFYYGYNDGQ